MVEFENGCSDLLEVKASLVNGLLLQQSPGHENPVILASQTPFSVSGVEALMILVSVVKWVDEVILDAPYAITKEFMKKLFNEYKIDYIIHGDDPCLLPEELMLMPLLKRMVVISRSNALKECRAPTLLVLILLF
ncbi:hypothetical protein GIB67_035019 [Kingdonia uniflora]|uniref:Ethanolamine-phosphate cytidylyltransferase n=1 Tax=Kingdonia uniflora TaxID=39325 RepID=A0A7J7L1D9_9MAGN|nr:hypothetical protein GIB67_035019 [Kingdonia uniflora]